MKLKRYIWYAVFLIALGLLLWMMPKKVNWDPSFSLEHTRPYGNKMLYDLLPHYFPSGDIQVNDRTLYENEEFLSLSNTNLFIVTDYLTMDSLDQDQLINFVTNGNDVLISSSSFPEKLLDTLHFDYEYDYSITDIIKLRSTPCYQYFPENHPLDSDTLFIRTPGECIYLRALTDSIQDHASLLWKDENKRAVMVRRKVGEGYFYLHSNPYLFTNYHMLHDTSRAHIAGSLAYLTKDDVIWDEYYKPSGVIEESKESSWNVVFKNKPLKIAYYILMWTSLIYILFFSKRKQRAIPVLDSYPNDSKELVETIGDLYFNNSTHNEIANQKIDLFYKKMYRKIGLKKEMSYQDQLMLLTNKLYLKENESKQALNLITKVIKSDLKSSEDLKVLNEILNKIMYPDKSK